MSQSVKGRHFGMVRELRLADWMTLFNGTAGMGAIFAALDYCITERREAIWLSAALLALALVFDVLDGRVARTRQQASDVGRELDSLSDVVSFGVAPAVLGYAVGLRGALDMLLLTVFVACGISRLARYNVTAVARAEATGKVRFFEGLPIPSSLLLVTLLLCLFAAGHTGASLPGAELDLLGLQLHPIALLYLLHGFAMVSRTIHIPKP